MKRMMEAWKVKEVEKSTRKEVENDEVVDDEVFEDTLTVRDDLVVVNRTRDQTLEQRCRCSAVQVGELEILTRLGRQEGRWR